MKKGTIIKIVVGSICAAGVTTILYLKKKTKMEEMEIEDLHKEIDNSTFDETVSSDAKDIHKRNQDEIHQFIAYLVKNGRNIEEVTSICETISLIEQLYLDTEYPEVRRQMLELMESEFDIEKTMEFDKNNYMIMYSSIDPSEHFNKNGFTILSMGPEYQEKLMDLADALAELKETNCSEFAEVMYDLFHIFTTVDMDTISSAFYTEVFQKYVDKYIGDSTESHDIKEE